MGGRNRSGVKDVSVDISESKGLTNESIGEAGEYKQFGWNGEVKLGNDNGWVA